MLDAATKFFINSKENNITSSAMNLSPLFDWYKDDFGDMRNFIAKYSKIKPSATASISYQKYNWNLNE